MIQHKLTLLVQITRLVCVIVMAYGLLACSRPVGSDDPSSEVQPHHSTPVKSPVKAKVYFETYILKAIEQINAKYRLLGYDINSVFTHDLTYGPYGTIKSTNGTLTMCVAGVLEIIIGAMHIWEKETGDKSVWDFLPKTSYQRLGVNDFRGHVWVNPRFASAGTADALTHFGMGERVPFEELRPGTFINFDRTNRSGHAVVFMSYIDAKGRELKQYTSDAIGFKYYGAQGLRPIGQGGFDYRYAVFSKFGCPEMPYKRDCGVIYSKVPKYFNTGRMWAPVSWSKPQLAKALSRTEDLGESQLDPNYYNGITTDDLE